MAGKKPLVRWRGLHHPSLVNGCDDDESDDCVTSDR